MLGKMYLHDGDREGGTNADMMRTEGGCTVPALCGCFADNGLACDSRYADT